MPTECPKGMPGICLGCSDLWEGNCCWFFPKRPLSEMLTPHERMDMLEAKPTMTMTWDKRQQYQIQQLKGEINYIEKRINMLQKGRKRESVF